MKLREIMSENVEAISADTTLAEAAKTMARRDIGFLPVMDGGQCSGAVTDRDIIVRGLAKDCDPTTTRVGDIMTRGAETLSPDDDLERAAELMESKRIRRLVIQDESGNCVGVVSLGDIALRAHELELAGEAMEKVCERVGA